ncbi:hypothetical protein CE180_29170, partial [Klebsiella pneumoniae]
TDTEQRQTSRRARRIQRRKSTLKADRGKQNKRLTLKEESVIYATSRQSAKARRNCSLTIYQTICVGTQSDMDS